MVSKNNLNENYMTIFYNLTTHPFPWNFLKVNKSKTKSPTKFERKFKEKQTPTYTVKSNRRIENPTLS